MRDEVTVHVRAPAHEIWELVADVRNTGRFSPETLEAEWLDGATGPAPGARFRGHVKRNGRGPMYWTVCRITACEPGREFGFAVLAGSRTINTWHYRFTPAGDGTDVTESFALADNVGTRIYWAIAGRARRRTNLRGMTETLHRIREVAEGARSDDGGAGASG
ncbi:cyclase [Pseudonocardia sp. EC080610-09]|uniref:SRPBCC family protein n=1 Tax=unclassified Pseudonocardia TaxID=2619320 RepID=UPI0006CB4AC6|nr:MULTISPECIES: SRPBCC family protein [unclassified Pseudonocardia]ALE75402.1 cyclase [Pseudonocardia sp. EC080625-04]ALL74768.1 cyclase [Pseudonocardia sp. EC080610-09]ALL81791.1 cyclase [Pseudonocardia sp. EC080619-01]